MVGRVPRQGGYKASLVLITDPELLVGHHLSHQIFHITVLTPANASRCGTAAGGRPDSFAVSAITALLGSGTPHSHAALGYNTVYNTSTRSSCTLTLFAIRTDRLG